MRKDKSKIIEMRSSGMSYSDISKSTGVSKSTLSVWFSDDKISQEVKRTLITKNAKISIERIRSLNKVRGNLLNAYYNEAEIEARDYMRGNINNPLFIFGLATYWGEGDKASKNGFRVSNSDPYLIKLFIKFLLKECLVEKDKIRLYLMIYSDIDPDESVNYWSVQVGLNKSHFTKPYVLQGRHKTKKLPYGTCIVSVANSYLKKKMMVWLKELSEML